MSVQEKLYTADELWILSHLPENRAKRLEFSEGVLIEMSPAGGEHGVIALQLGRLIGNFVEDKNLGEATAAETGYVLHVSANGKATVHPPDVGYVQWSRIPEGGLPDNYVPFAHDLAVEVMSPNDTPAEIETKIDEYLRYGTRMVVVVYPDARIVYIHTPTQTRRLTVDDVLDGNDVLPGFALLARDIFQRRLPQGQG